MDVQYSPTPYKAALSFHGPLHTRMHGAAVTQKQFKTTAQSLDLKFPTAGADLIAFAKVFQGSLATAKKILSCYFQTDHNICQGVNYIKEKSVVTKQEKSSRVATVSEERKSC